MRRRSKSGLLALGVLFLLFLLLNPSGAWAGGGTSYPNGSESFMVGAAPPPGFYLKNYVKHLRRFFWRNVLCSPDFV